MFKGSKNVSAEAHTSMLASVGGQSNAYTTDDETVFWETVPSHYLPLVLWLEADRIGVAADRQGHLHQRARRGEGRTADARGQPAVRPAERDHLRPGILRASLQARHDRQHARPRGRIGRRCARFLSDYYVPANATLVLVGDFDSCRRLQLVSQYVAVCEGRNRAVPREHPQDPPQTKEKRVTLQEPGRSRQWSWRITSSRTATPTRIRCTLPRRCSRRPDVAHLSEDWSTRSRCGGRLATRNLIEDPNLFYAVAIVRRGIRRTSEDALIAELDRLKTEPITAHELQRTKNQSRATTSWAASRISRKALQCRTPS